MKLTKKVENSQKKYFEELSGARSTRKLIEIHNRCLLLRSEKFHDSIFPSEGHKTGKIQISVSRKVKLFGILIFDFKRSLLSLTEMHKQH